MATMKKVPLSQANPSLAHMIEDTILFGKEKEFSDLIDTIKDHPDVPPDLAYGLEGLRFFRAQYHETSSRLSTLAQQRVSQFDTLWSMQLLDLMSEGRWLDDARNEREEETEQEAFFRIA